MLRGIFNFLFSCAFVALLPLFWFAAQWFGSADEKWLMRAAMCALSPLCAALWYPVVARKHFSYLLQIAIIIGGYVLIAMLLKLRVVTF